MGLLEGNLCFIDALTSQIKRHEDEIRWLKMIRKLAEEGLKNG